MGDRRTNGETLAAVMVIVAMVVFCLAIASGVLGYRSYLAQKQAVRARSIKVLKQIEAREAERRDAELFGGVRENR